MPKRKASGDTSKSSGAMSKKKQRLAEARARAMQWAKEEEEKKKQKTKPVDPMPKKSPAKNKTASTSNTKKIKKSLAKNKTASTSNTKKIKKSLAEETQNETTNQKTPSKKKASGKASRIAQARANAKAWAASEEAKKMKKAVAKVENEEEQFSSAIDDSAEISVDDSSMPDADGNVDETVPSAAVDIVSKNTVELSSGKPDAASTKSSSVAEKAVLWPTTQQTNPYNAESKVRLEKLSVAKSSAYPKIPVGLNNGPSTAKTTVQPNPYNIQPKSLLEKSGMIKKHVIPDEDSNFSTPISDAKMVAKSSEISELPHEETQNDGCMIEQESNEEYSEYSDKPKKPGRRYLFSICLLLALGGLIAAFSLGKLNFILDMVPKELSSKLQKKVGELYPSETMINAVQSIVSKERSRPCFIDDYEFGANETRPKSSVECDKNLDRTPCPEEGLCADGLLHVCLDEDKIPSPDGSQCVWSEESNYSFAMTEALLTNWTIQHNCNLRQLKFAYKSDDLKSAVFPFKKVVNETKIRREMLSGSTDFTVVEINEELMIGLSDQYVDTKLVLPTSCFMTLTFLQSISFFGGLALSALVRVTTSAFDFAHAFPIISLVSIVLLLIILRIRGRQLEQKQLAEDAVAVRELAYKNLRAETSPQVVLHVRDAIAMDMHPMSRKGRSYVILKVWPRVVADVRLDNRVLKSSRQVGGKPRDVWQWVASTPAKE